MHMMIENIRMCVCVERKHRRVCVLRENIRVCVCLPLLRPTWNVIVDPTQCRNTTCAYVVDVCRTCNRMMHASLGGGLPWALLEPHRVCSCPPCVQLNHVCVHAMCVQLNHVFYVPCVQFQHVQLPEKHILVYHYLVHANVHICPSPPHPAVCLVCFHVVLAF